jgi:hypothetical protein
MRNSYVGLLLLGACLGLASVRVTADDNFPGVFHIAGVPELKSDQRVGLHLALDSLTVERAKVTYSVPYARIKQVLLFHAARNYEKSAGTAASASTLAIGIPVGALLMLKKHKVDTVIIDYENERHGRMGIVLQVERGQGEEVGAILKKHGVTVVDPPADTPAGAKAAPATSSPEPRRPQ